MSTKRKKTVIKLPGSSRRKWARRGRGIGDFATSLLFSVSENIVDFGIHCGKRICSGVSAMRKKRKQQATASSNAGNGRSNAAVVVEPCFKPLSKRDIAKVKFDQVAGLEEPKKIIMQCAQDPVKFKSKAAILDINEGGGILLVGPPGNGKSMLIKAVANEIDMAVFEITPVDIIMGNQSGSLRKVRELFRIARSFPRVLIVLNEFEGIARKSNSSIISSVNSQMLIETSGFMTEKSKNMLLMIGTSNVPEIMRSALLRSGRFEVVFVGVPGFDARRLILKSGLNGVPVSDDIDFDSIADRTRMFSGADLTDGLITKAKRNTLDRSKSLAGKNDVYPVSMEDFEMVLRGMKPSIGEPALRKWYPDLSVIT